MRNGLYFFLLCFTGTVLGKEPPNILFLLVDDQRPDTIGAYGNDKISTPNLDQLAKRGTRFTRATCSYPICHISRAEMLSGRHGWENGINGLNSRRFSEGIDFWAETLRNSDYRTCYVGKWHTPGRPADYGFSEVRGLFGSGSAKLMKPGQTDWKGFPITGYKGWVFQDATGKERYPEKGVGLTPDIDAKFGDAAISAITDFNGDQPWFIQVNFTGPHDPLFIPPGYEGKYRAEEMPVPPNFMPEHPYDHGNLKGRDEMLLPFPRTREDVRDLLRVYYSVIDHIDLQVGKIVKALRDSGQLDNTVIIYSSDHGMAVGSHGLRGKQNQYEHTINVPMIIAGPGVKADYVTDASVYLRDLYPTTCELADVAIPGTVTAKSFAGVLNGSTETHHDEIYGYFTDTQRMIRTDRWKYIEYPKVEKRQLFDLESDPDELTNLIEDPDLQSVTSRLAEKLMKWRKEKGDPALTLSPPPQ